MWIKMLKDQPKPWGIFLKGQTHSLPAATVEKLDVDSYEQIDVDDETMEKLGVQDRIKHLTAEIAMLNSSIEASSKHLTDLKRRRKMIQDKIRQANEELKRIEAEAKTKTESADEGQATNADAQTTETAAAGQPAAKTPKDDKSVTAG